jgi:hypothetical protein
MSSPKKAANNRGWKELTVQDWLYHVCTTPPTSESSDIELSTPYATSVLITVSRAWDVSTDQQKAQLIDLLAPKSCMPTLNGDLKKPADTYFPNVKVLPNLPIITTIRGIKGNFLKALGVRTTVALQLIFQRLEEGGSWSHLDGVRYLTSIRRSSPVN